MSGGALLDRPCMAFHRMDVLCLCDLSVHIGVPSIGFVYVFVCRRLSPHLKEFEIWIIGVGSLYVVSLCDFAYHVVG